MTPAFIETEEKSGNKNAEKKPTDGAFYGFI